MIYNFNTRPYIVINGKDSREIPGLIICSLPPITLPPVRNLIETVDGRDGDIITRLGYEAYDKVIEIGLAKEYNVDDIISYFATSGEIVFGNEPDKYYIFTNLQPINFERLLRMKKASVTLHIQPFKYAEDEDVRSIVYSQYGGTKRFEVRNSGNIFSRPKISIKASGDVNLGINETVVLAISFPYTDDTITIDSEAFEAYYSNGEYANRRVSGNYDNIKLIPGYNSIMIQGAVKKIEISKTSRWL